MKLGQDVRIWVNLCKKKNTLVRRINSIDGEKKPLVQIYFLKKITKLKNGQKNIKRRQNLDRIMQKKSPNILRWIRVDGEGKKSFNMKIFKIRFLEKIIKMEND